MIENDEQGKKIYKTIIEKNKIITIYAIEIEKLKNSFKNIIKNKNDINLELISRLRDDSSINEELKRQKNSQDILKDLLIILILNK